MPREIITLQVGQCGNQSKYIQRLFVDTRCAVQLVMSSGSSCVWSMESVRREYCRSMQHRVMIGKMYSSIRRMMSIIYRELCLLIQSQGLSIRYRLDCLQICTTRRTSMYRSMEEVQVTIGVKVSRERIFKQTY